MADFEYCGSNRACGTGISPRDAHDAVVTNSAHGEVFYIEMLELEQGIRAILEILITSRLARST